MSAGQREIEREACARLLEDCTEAVWVLGAGAAAGEIRYANRAAASVPGAGFSAGERFGHPGILARGGGELGVGEGIGRRVLEFSVSPARWGGEPAQLVVARDISGRVEREEQRLRKQKMEAVAALASGVAHQFNNLLAVIQLTAGAIGRGTFEADGQTVENIVQTCRRGLNLVAQMLNFTEMESPALEPLELGALIREAAPRLAEVAGAAARVEIVDPGAEVWVVGDREMLRQVALALAANAGEAMAPGGGKLAITLGPGLVAGGGGGFASLEFSDEGPGMEAEEVEKAFLPFFTTKDPGTAVGLGLTAAFQIVEGHGGWIDLTSAPGEGTRVRVNLPRPAALEA